MSSSVSGGAARLMVDRKCFKTARTSGAHAAMYCSKFSGLLRVAATLRCLDGRYLGNMRKSGFDRAPDLIIELACILAGGGDRFADDHPDHAGLLDDPTPYPEVGRVMRQRHHKFSGFSRQQRAAHAVFALFAGYHARSFRKDNDPKPVGQTSFPLLDDLVN